MNFVITVFMICVTIILCGLMYTYVCLQEHKDFCSEDRYNALLQMYDSLLQDYRNLQFELDELEDTVSDALFRN